MVDYVIDSFLATKTQMIYKTSKKYNAFELFGYDFLFDDDLRIWLLEINTNPCLAMPNDFMKELVPQMIDDIYDL